MPSRSKDRRIGNRIKINPLEETRITSNHIVHTGKHGFTHTDRHLHPHVHISYPPLMYARTQRAREGEINGGDSYLIQKSAAKDMEEL